VHINVIPQDPLFLPGTFKFNIDPPVRMDDRIESALKMVVLWKRMSINGTLEMALSVSDWPGRKTVDGTCAGSDDAELDFDFG
jgi:hypothetical protein